MPFIARPHYRQAITAQDHVTIPGEVHGLPGDRFIVYAVTPPWSDNPEHPQADDLPLQRVDIDPVTHTVHLTFAAKCSGTIYLLAIERRPTTVHRPGPDGPI